MKYVLFYGSADDVATRARPHVAEHDELLRAFHDRGELLMVGVFGDPQKEGAMAVFTTEEAAEGFVAADPFVTHGVVARHEIRSWHEILT